MGNQLTLCGLAQRAQRKQTGMVAKLASELGLAHRLRRATTKAGDQDRLARFSRLFFGCRGRQFKHGAQQTVFRLANGELCRVDSDSQPARAGRQVIACQRALAMLVQFSATPHCQRVRGDNQPVAQTIQHPTRRFRELIHWLILHISLTSYKRPGIFPFRASKCVGLFNKPAT